MMRTGRDHGASPVDRKENSMDGPVGSVWRRSRRRHPFSEGWRALLESTAGQTTGAGTSPGLPDPLQVLTRSAADYAAAALQPLRDLADGQRDFANQMTRWAELQRDLADNMVRGRRGSGSTPTTSTACSPPSRTSEIGRLTSMIAHESWSELTGTNGPAGRGVAG